MPVLGQGFIWSNFIGTGGSGSGTPEFEEYDDLAAFPATGKSGIYYVALDTKKLYMWSGSAYVEVSPSEVVSVAGKTGAVNLEIGDVDSLTAALAGKAATSHTHAISDVTGLADELDGLADNISNIEAEIAAIVTPSLYSNGSSQAIDWANGLWQSITASGNLAISFTGTPPVGATLRIRVTASGADRTVTFPTGVIFDYDVAAVTVASGFTKTFYGVWDGTAYEFGYGPDRGAL